MVLVLVGPQHHNVGVLAASKSARRRERDAQRLSQAECYCHFVGCYPKIKAAGAGMLLFNQIYLWMRQLAHI